LEPDPEDEDEAGELPLALPSDVSSSAGVVVGGGSLQRDFVRKRT